VDRRRGPDIPSIKTQPVDDLKGQHKINSYMLRALTFTLNAVSRSILQPGLVCRWKHHELRDLHFDVLIALTARSYGARLITTNRADFEMIHSVRKIQLEIW
jgi:predicted nucleic acid-binding protein